MDVLIEHLGDDDAINGPAVPEDMRTWRHAIVDARNPVADWMDLHVRVTTCNADATSLGILYTAAMRDGVAVPKQRFFAFAKSYFAARNCPVNPRSERFGVDGDTATSVATVNVVRGVLLY